jgi:hypothetical protein
MKPTLEILKQESKRLLFEDHDECIIYPGYKDKDGYRHFQFRQNTIKYNIQAHRAAYMMYNNIELNTDQIIMHMCDNPSCINPKHLKLGTHYDNVQDRVSKKRSASGKRNGRYTHGKYAS